MITIIGVRFRHGGKIYYFQPGPNVIETGDRVIVETSRGVEFGLVVHGLRLASDADVVAPVRTILRRATEKDEEINRRNIQAEKEAMEICREKIANRGLDMKLIEAEYTFDGNKILFYFTADGRVDFRELVKDLASVFHIRIELRQVGIRDETRILGGIAPCGRECCCAGALPEFKKVSIKMAKVQGLSLNPGKISGLCGRLMCCLKYENNHYTETARLMPKVGSEVVTPDGRARVESVNLLKKSVLVKIVNGDAVEFKTFDVADVKAKKTIAEDVDDTVADEEIKSILD